MPAIRRLVDLGLSLLPVFGRKDSDYRNCVNTAQSRGCWRDGFNINTDYEVEVPPGKLVEVKFIILRHK